MDLLMVNSTKLECSLPNESVWKASQDKGLQSHLIDCVGRILHEYLSPIS
jgi:hypothetical protein